MSEERLPVIEQLVSVPVYLFAEELPRGHLRVPKRMADEIARAAKGGLRFSAFPQVKWLSGDDGSDESIRLVGLTVEFTPASKKA